MKHGDLKMKNKTHKVYLILISAFNDEKYNLQKCNIRQVQSIDMNFFRIMQGNQELIELEMKFLENKLETKIS